jgi:hypothetical protein
VTGIIDYVFLFASKSAAQGSSSIGSLVNAGSVSFGGLAVTTSQALVNGIAPSAGYWIMVASVGQNSTYDTDPNAVLTINRDTQKIVSSRLTAAGTASFSFSPVPEGGGYGALYPWLSGTAQAAAAGYATHTYSASSFSTANVDMAKTYAPGFELYLANFFGVQTAPSAVTFNGDGSLSALSPGNSNTTLASCAAISGGAGFVGTAFGGGAFVVAQIAFDPTTVTQALGWPSVWAMAIEHLCNMNIQWPGQAAGYGHFIEADIFEWVRYQPTYPGAYAATLHDWYGIWTSGGGWQVANSDFNAGTAKSAATIDWTQWQTVAMLWIPATATTPGSIKFFLNDSQVGPGITWTQFTGQAPPPGPAAPWTFGIIDQQHLGVIVGSSSGPIKVKSIDVWQVDGSNNLIA